MKGLERVEQIDKAIRCLNAAGWNAQAQNDGFLIVPTASRDAAAQINSLLVNHGFEVFHIAMAQASLEDIFLTLTNGRGEARRAA